MQIVDLLVNVRNNHQLRYEHSYQVVTDQDTSVAHTLASVIKAKVIESIYECYHGNLYPEVL